MPKETKEVIIERLDNLKEMIIKFEDETNKHFERINGRTQKNELGIMQTQENLKSHVDNHALSRWIYGFILSVIAILISLGIAFISRR